MYPMQLPSRLAAVPVDSSHDLFGGYDRRRDSSDENSSSSGSDLSSSATSDDADFPPYRFHFTERLNDGIGDGHSADSELHQRHSSSERLSETPRADGVCNADAARSPPTSWTTSQLVEPGSLADHFDRRDDTNVDNDFFFGALFLIFILLSSWLRGWTIRDLLFRTPEIIVLVVTGISLHWRWKISRSTPSSHVPVALSARNDVVAPKERYRPRKSQRRARKESHAVSRPSSDRARSPSNPSRTPSVPPPVAKSQTWQPTPEPAESTITAAAAASSLSSSSPLLSPASTASSSPNLRPSRPRTPVLDRVKLAPWQFPARGHGVVHDTASYLSEGTVFETVVFSGEFIGMRRSEKSELFYGYRPVGYPQKLVVAHQRPDGSVACLRISQDVRLEKGNKLGVELHVMSLVKAEQPDPDSGRAKMSMGKAEQAGSDGGRAKIVIRPEPGLRVALTEFDQLDLRGVYDVRNVRISAVRIGRVVEESMGSLKEYYAEVVLGPMGADFIRYQGSSGQRSRT